MIKVKSMDKWKFTMKIERSLKQQNIKADFLKENKYFTTTLENYSEMQTTVIIKSMV